eukprot:TRINITY_DN3097_c0_g1_i1.p1 TRINITY_DN3097_c0_g1~~TRINITY_DN3097_c0_g1_i1.p1  ORF type:complete len:611 (-),score=205.11 TRINITY_DN3097_c0_g1_i1:16-1848(-)
MSLSVLFLTIKQGRDLVAADKGGTSDPYVSMDFTHKGKEKKIKTKVVKKTLNPVWNEQVEIQYSNPSEVINMRVYDQDLMSSTAIGNISFAVSVFQELVMAGKNEEWFNLEGVPKGSIHLQFYFNPPLATASAVASTPFLQTEANANVQQSQLPAMVQSGLASEATRSLEVTFGPKVSVETDGITRNEFRFTGYGENTISCIAGQPVDICVVVSVADPQIDVRSAWISFKGTTQEGSSKAKKITSCLFNLVTEGAKLSLTKGKHSFPFRFTIPPHSPTSGTIGPLSTRYVISLEADVINKEDCAANAEVWVMNIGDTAVGKVPRPVSQSSEVKVMGKTIQMNASILKDYYTTLEDVEMKIEVKNEYTKKLKRILVSLQKKTKCNGREDTVDVASRDCKFFKPVYPGTSQSNVCIFEMPNSLTRTFNAASSYSEYKLKIRLDIPGAPDINISLPITVVEKEPVASYKIKPTGVLPVDVKSWKTSQVNDWCRINDFQEAARQVIILDINGDEFYKWVLLKKRKSFEALCTLEPNSVDRFVKTIEETVNQSMLATQNPLEIFLRRIGLAHHLAAFTKEEVTIDLLPLLSESDLKQIVTLGATKKIMLELKRGQ